jgi:hypothetical protein
MTVPTGSVALLAVLTVPTVSFAATMAASAAVCVNPITLGTSAALTVGKARVGNKILTMTISFKRITFRFRRVPILRRFRTP